MTTGTESTAKPEMDPCCVETTQLCGLVQEFVTDWLKIRRSRKGQGYGKDPEPGHVDPVSPYTWLSFDTGIPESEIRKIRNPARFPLTELRVCDAVVNSIGSPDMFHDGGALTVLPNPLVTNGHGECCSGSEQTIVASVGTNVTPGMIVRATAPTSRRHH